jgi:hypothetical protein
MLCIFYFCMFVLEFQKLSEFFQIFLGLILFFCEFISFSRHRNPFPFPFSFSSFSHLFYFSPVFHAGPIPFPPPSSFLFSAGQTLSSRAFFSIRPDPAHPAPLHPHLLSAPPTGAPTCRGLPYLKLGSDSGPTRAPPGPIGARTPRAARPPARPPFLPCAPAPCSPPVPPLLLPRRARTCPLAILPGRHRRLSPHRLRRELLPFLPSFSPIPPLPACYRNRQTDAAVRCHCWPPPLPPAPLLLGPSAQVLAHRSAEPMPRREPPPHGTAAPPCRLPAPPPRQPCPLPPSDPRPTTQIASTPVNPSPRRSA